MKESEYQIKKVIGYDSIIILLKKPFVFINKNITL
jgi:hypothetical protein